MSDDPRIVHVASELCVPLTLEAENDGNLEYVIDVIAAVDYANEQCAMGYADALDAAVKAAQSVSMLLPDGSVKPPEHVVTEVIIAIDALRADHG